METPVPVRSLKLKGQSYEIKVWFSWVKWIEKMLLIFPQKGLSSLYQCFND